jgi:uncharacterized protein YecE (DUF72 family)
MLWKLFFKTMDQDSSKKFIHFGTSSWAYEGWKGIVYFKEYPANRFKKDCLAEYAADERFSTVGMDLFFYQPPSENLLLHYASLLPKNFKTCSKVWEALTIARYANQARYGKFKGQINPNFLNANLFTNQILNPYQAVFQEHTGPFIFEFQYIKKDDKSFPDFVADLDRFFSNIPNDFQYSVEIRNKNFLRPEYFEILHKYNVAHVFNHWSYMPPIHEQLSKAQLTSNFVVARLLTPLGMPYQETVKKFSPFNKIVEPQHKMREDVVSLAERATSKRIPAYLLFNNRIEGCAPYTISEINNTIHESFAAG